MKNRSGSGGLRSMRARMTAVFALIVALLMVGVVLGVLRFERRRAQVRVTESLQIAIDRAGHEIREDQEDHERSTSFLKSVQEAQGEIAAGGLVLMVIRGKKVIWRSQIQSPSWPRPGASWNFRTLSGGEQTLVIARSWAPDEEELRATAGELAVLALLVIAVTTILAWFVVGQTLSPIGRLAHQAQEATLEGVSVRLQAPSSDAEMRHLTGTLNNLLGHVEREMQARAHFYAAASHELRTPIQILLGEIEVARARPRTVQEHEEVLVQVHHSTERLATLVQDLLQLNALEMRQNLTPGEEINLAFWVERSLSQQSTALQTRDLSVETILPEVIINASSAHVEMLLRNLVENAAKYATPGSVIHLALTSSPDGATFEIDNDCHLPTETKLAEWFEPFFRPDASRSSQTGGNGLGLAICRAICLSNDWQMSLSPHKNGIRAIVNFHNG